MGPPSRFLRLLARHTCEVKLRSEGDEKKEICLAEGLMRRISASARCKVGYDLGLPYYCYRNCLWLVCSWYLRFHRRFCGTFAFPPPSHVLQTSYPEGELPLIPTGTDHLAVYQIVLCFGNGAGFVNYQSFKISYDHLEVSGCSLRLPMGLPYRCLHLFVRGRVAWCAHVSEAAPNEPRICPAKTTRPAVITGELNVTTNNLLRSLLAELAQTYMSNRHGS
ncbi:hypothetical protein GGR53DRAFT_251656 [Hypoxylon sp. FL1150]|nr:hypothetical protein GGR53DRAFT_251656 [Hypoxylon sp. FL1150]